MLLEQGVVDEVLPEPLGGAHNDPEQAAVALGSALRRHLADLQKLDTASLLQGRYDRFRKLGVHAIRE